MKTVTLEMMVPDDKADTILDALAAVTAAVEWQGFVSDEWSRAAMDTEEIVKYRIRK